MFFDKWLVGEERVTAFAWLVYICLVIGLLKLLIWILTPLCICLRHCCRCKQNLNAKYGRADNSAYAVVTGGSDGIGFELCN